MRNDEQKVSAADGGAEAADYLRASLASLRSILLVGAVPREALPVPLQDRADLFEIGDHDSSADSFEVHSLARAVSDRRIGCPCLIITVKPLHVRGLSVAGFAHKRPGIALVSLAAIADSADVQITRSRLTNLITHELWHLKGWPHCSQNCVMRPIRAASELDTRLLSLCKGCSKGPQRSIVRYAAAALILALLLVGTNEGLSHLFPLFDTPFSCFATDCHGLCSRPANAPSDSVAIYFQERKLFALRAREDGRSLRDRSVPVVIELNRIAHSSQSMPFVVTRTETDQYGVAIPGNAPLLQVLPRDLSSGETASQLAAHWATALNSALQARTPRNN